MKYIVKDSENKLMTMVVASGMPQLPEGFEVVGLDEMVNPNGLSLEVAELIQAEIEPSFQKVVTEAIEEVRDEDDNVIVEAQSATYVTVPAVVGPRLVASLPGARAVKLSYIRMERDAKLIANDKAFMIAFKKDEDLAAIREEAQALRDIPQTASEAMAEMTSVEEINAYNPFGA